MLKETNEPGLLDMACDHSGCFNVYRWRVVYGWPKGWVETEVFGQYPQHFCPRHRDRTPPAEPTLVEIPGRPRRLKILRITDTCLLELLMQQAILAEVTEDSIPADTRIADVRWDGFRQCVELLLESDEFPEVPEGNAVLAIVPVYRRVVW